LDAIPSSAIVSANTSPEHGRHAPAAEAPNEPASGRLPDQRANCREQQHEPERPVAQRQPRLRIGDARDPVASASPFRQKIAATATRAASGRAVSLTFNETMPETPLLFDRRI